MRPTVLAMDLEGTLISNAVSQIPRPGLYAFLESVRGEFERLVLFTSVPEPRARSIIERLVREASAPPWFARLDYINWHGPTKDLRLVSPVVGSSLLIDDHQAYVHPGQEDWWIEVPLFASPYDAGDSGLLVVQALLRGKLESLSAVDCSGCKGTAVPAASRPSEE